MGNESANEVSTFPTSKYDDFREKAGKTAVYGRKSSCFTIAELSAFRHIVDVEITGTRDFNLQPSDFNLQPGDFNLQCSDLTRESPLNSVT